MYNPYFTVNPHVWVRTRPWFPPIVEDERELKKFAKCLIKESKNLSVLPAGLVDDAVFSLGLYYAFLDSPLLFIIGIVVGIII